MLKKRIRFFFGLDVLKTEAWLARMAQQGYHLVSVSFFFRCFTFEQCEPASINYRLYYEKRSNGELPETLLTSDWNIIAHNKHWIFIYRDAKSNGNAPSYTSILTRNRKLKFGIGIVLLTIICIFVIPAFLFFIIIFFVIFALFAGEDMVDRHLKKSPWNLCRLKQKCFW